MDCIDKCDILNELIAEKQFLRNDDEKYEKYNELQELVEQIDLSVLETNDDENITPSTSKRRKISRLGSESNDSQLERHEKELEETVKQIELVKKALTVIYEMESTSFKKFVSKYGVKRRNAVSKVTLFKRIKDNGKVIPLWIGREDETPPELCGAIQADKNYVAEIGDIVAALVINDKKENNWILAEVVAYDPNRKEYIVDDIYDDPKKEQTISWKRVIPLPKMRADPETNPDALFPKDAFVLALFPGTTCFYPAVVGELPTKPQDPYKLLFEDNTYESGFSGPIKVPQRYVIRYEDSSDIKGKTEESRK